MIVALGGVGQHARAAAAGWIADVIPGDLVITSIRPIGEDEGVEADLIGAVPGHRPGQPDRDLRCRARRCPDRRRGGGRRRLRRGRPARGSSPAIGRRRWRRSMPAVRRSSRSALADRLGLTIDQVLTVPTADGGALELRVAGIVDRSIPGRTGEAMLLGWTDATGALGVAGADVFALRFAPGRPGFGPRRPASGGRAARARGRPARPDPGRHQRCARSDLRAVRCARGGGGPDRRDGHREHADDERLERVREIGILRAAGMSRQQVWRSVVVEAGVLGLAGALLGIVLGLGVGAMMVVLAGGRLDVAGGVPWPVIGARARPRRRRGDARGGLSGPPGEPAVHRPGRPVRVTRC